MLMSSNPAGEGSAIEIAVTVTGQRASYLSTVTLSYASPSIVALTLLRSGSGVIMDCSRIDINGFPLSGTISTVRTAIVLIDGVNFGKNASNVHVIIHDQPCLLLEHDDSRLSCETPVCSGTSESLSA